MDIHDRAIARIKEDLADPVMQDYCAALAAIPEPAPLPEFLSVERFAEEIGWRARDVRRAIEAGKLPLDPRRGVASAHVAAFDGKDILDVLQAGKVYATKAPPPREVPAPPTAKIDRVLVMRSGFWNGEQFTPTQIQELERNFIALRDKLQPTVVCGSHDGTNGGIVLRVYSERDGQELYADLGHVPLDIAEKVNAKRYNTVSVLLKGRPGYGRCIDHVALLGEKLPGVHGQPELPKAEYETKSVERFERDDDGLITRKETWREKR